MKRNDGKKKATSSHLRKIRRKNQPPNRKICDRLWAKIAKIGITCCPICGETKFRLVAHHLIARQVIKYRWDLQNAMPMCSKCHKYGPTAVHSSPWFFEQWMVVHRPDQYKWWLSHRENVFDSIIPDYDQIFLGLLKNYKELSGEIVLTEEDEQTIITDYLSGNFSCRQLGRKFDVNVHTIAGILHRAGIKILDHVAMTKKKTIGIPRSEEHKAKMRKAKRRKHNVAFF